MAVTAAAIVTAAIGAGMAISGAVKKSKAKKLARNNKRPDYEIPQEERDNLNLAESLASQGLPESSKDIYVQNAQRGMTSSIDAILKGGGDVNAINRSQDIYQQNLSRLTLADNQQKLTNIQMLINQRNRMADNRDKEWQINKYAPYADRAAAAKEMSAAGEQQIWQGVGMVGSAVGSYAGGMGTAKDVKGVGGGFSGGIGGGSSGNYGLGGTNAGATMNRSYNPSTGSYYNSFNWNGMSDEQKIMLMNLNGTPQ